VSTNTGGLNRRDPTAVGLVVLDPVRNTASRVDLATVAEGELTPVTAGSHEDGVVSPHDTAAPGGFVRPCGSQVQLVRQRSNPGI
jgi:hypothetical protein